MSALFLVVNGLINGINYITSLIQSHPWYFCFGFGLVFALWYKKNWALSKTFLLAVKGFLIVDGMFGAGKTRFLALLAQEGRKQGMIILCNFYNSSENIRWNSTDDLIALMKDLWRLGEYQNYSFDELEIMYEKEGKKRLSEKKKSYIDIKKKYPNIPKNGFSSRFLLVGDEMQNIFFNRESVSNFSGDRKPLLKYLHQVRHFNVLGAFALTDKEEIDKKFKRIASHYVRVWDFLFLIRYNVFTAVFDKDGSFSDEKAVKLTKVPASHVNGYLLNKFLGYFESKLKRRIPKKYRFSELGFFTKFNADPDVSIYKEGYLLEYLNGYYANGRNSIDVNVRY